MFEKEIKFITDFSLEKIKSLGSYFTFEDILATEIHPSITKYISAELSYLIFEDREKLLSSSIFDYSRPNVIKLLKSVDNELKKFKAISYEDIKKLVLQSVSFNANFITRPKWSLSKLIYNEAETKSAEEIILMLDYIYFHEYLRNIVIEYIEKKKLLSITKNKFEEIISKIDTALIQNNMQSYIDNSLSTMLDFFSIGNKNKIKISTDYVEIFLKEKDLIDPLLKLKKTFVFGTGVAANIEEIKKVLFSEEIKIGTEQSEPTLVEEIEMNEKVTKEIEEEKETQTKDEISFNPLIDENEINVEDVNLSEPKEVIENVPGKEERLVTENQTEKIDDGIIPEKDKLLNTENDDELLTLFDEELKALADENDLDSDIDFPIEEDNNTNNEEKFSNENEVIQSNEQVEELETENEPAQAEEINDEVTAGDELIEDDFDEIQTTDLEEDFEESNFIEGIPDETFLTETDEQLEQEDISEEVKEEKTIEPEIETITKPEREKDIFYFLSDKDIEKIVSTVFNEDQEDFAITLEKVSECESRDAANEIIKGVYIYYRVNMYTKDASTLTTAITNYFNQ